MPFQDLRTIAQADFGSKSATNAEISSLSGHAVNSPIQQEYIMQTKDAALNAHRKMDSKNFGESDLVTFAYLECLQSRGRDGARTRGLRHDRPDKSEE